MWYWRIMTVMPLERTPGSQRRHSSSPNTIRVYHYRNTPLLPFPFMEPQVAYTVKSNIDMISSSLYAYWLQGRLKQWLCWLLVWEVMCYISADSDKHLHMQHLVHATMKKGPLIHYNKWKVWEYSKVIFSSPYSGLFPM